MMYRRVGNALLQAGSSAHPQDYLLFLTPLAREDKDEVPDCLEDNFELGSNAEKLRSSRRLMIYVHSKLMVVDDSAAIIGVPYCMNHLFSFEQSLNSILVITIANLVSIICKAAPISTSALSLARETQNWRLSYIRFNITKKYNVFAFNS